MPAQHARCLRHGQRNAGAPSMYRRPGGASLPLAHGARYIHSKVRISMSIRQSPQPTERAQAARSANAQQATGPATPEGKARSKMNALKYGDHARDFRQAIKLQGDDVQAFDGLYHALLDHYQPEPPETAFQAADLAKLRWQAHRGAGRHSRRLGP